MKVFSHTTFLVGRRQKPTMRDALVLSIHGLLLWALVDIRTDIHCVTSWSGLSYLRIDREG